MYVRGLKTKPLDQQVIVITGASSGIGLATARLAAKAGARVVITSRNNDELQRVCEKLKSENGQVIAEPADVSVFDDMKRVRDRAVEAFGGIDTWVNNAGVSIYGRLIDVPENEERQLFETNFWGVRNGCMAAVSALIERGGGVLINLGSEVSGRSVPLQGMYAATKHAIKAYTDALRVELQHDGSPVAVCLIRPAGIDTPFTEHARNRLREGEPSLPPPVYQPEVVAKAILRAAVSPQRDVYVGSASRFVTLMDALAPRLSDLIIGASLFDGQARGGTTPHRARQESLSRPPAREGRERGNHRGMVRRRSFYTAATQHPWATLAVAGAAGLLLWSRSARAPTLSSARSN